jgi:biotin-dependent carboxylase-like uncharacterized protein
MTSLQDLGRFGWQRYGVGTSGAMDRLALAAANTLVGNAAGAAAIEFMLLGGEFRALGGSVRVAVAGAACSVLLDGEAVPHTASMILRDGQKVTIGAAQSGVYAYLAVAGGLAAEPQLGGLSLHRRARLGGLDGRPLQPGDHVPLILTEAPAGEEFRLDPLPFHETEAIRVVLGPQDDHFTAAGIETFLTSAYRLSSEADRMGYRLSGPPIEHAAGYNIVSDGIVTGSVQVPGSREPLVLMADRQTTGGYPKIATVITADIGIAGQLGAGDTIAFEVCTPRDAIAALIAQERLLMDLDLLAQS